MTPRDIDRFFKAFARRWTGPMEVILIGGAAAVIAGSRRRTLDVDFEARFPRGHTPEDGDLVASAVHRATVDSGVRSQFAVDIGAWSDVAMPDYRNSARPWKRFGTIRVRLLDPAVYVISKLRRGAAKDFEDIAFCSRAWRLSWRRLARVCGLAVRRSPPSTQLPRFKERVIHLFRAHGRALWGRAFDPEDAIALFRTCSISSRRARG